MPILTIDARGYKPEDRDRVITTMFDSLDSGERMIIINDSDPSPILERIEDDNDNIVEWEIYKNDPGHFEAAVSKRYQHYI